MSRPVRCARCHRENEPTLRACVDCGEPLPGAARRATCAACGAALEAGSRFCGSCGAPFAAAPAPGAPAPQPRPAAAPPRVTAVRSDGAPGPSMPLAAEVLLGRTEGEVRLGHDPAVSPRHARFSSAGGVLRVEDLGSANGTYLRLRGARRLRPGEELRVGRQRLRLEPLPRPAPAPEDGGRPWGSPDPGARYRLVQLLDGGGAGDVFPLRDGENALGREAGDVTFPADRYVSGRHARIEVRGDEITLEDTASSNGTFVRIAGPTALEPGDELLVGSQLLRIDR